MILYFDPGDKVWFWTLRVREPVQVTVDDVCIWIDDRGITLSYSLRERQLGFGRVSDLFATREEAEKHRDDVIQRLRESMEKN